MTSPGGRPRRYESPVLRWLAGPLLFLLGIAASFIVHWPTLHYGFVYDDYGFVRPHTVAEVLASFTGPWDPHGPNVAFFRPLTVALHAMRFEWFQFDPRAHHVLSLASFGVTLGLLGVTVWRIAASATVALLAITLTAAHPHMPYAATAWITNQMHLCQLVIFVASFGWWWCCRERRWPWWTPLLLAQLAAFLIKEDGVMLAPSILAAHVLWTWTQAGRPALPPWPYLGLALLVGGVAVWWRHAALGGVGGYREPSWALAWSNYWRGYWRTLLLLPVDRPGKLVATAFVVVTSGLGGLAALRVRGRALFLYAVGLAIVTLWNVPYVFVSKREQWYLLSLGGAIALTGGTWALWRVLRPRALRAAFAACTLAAILSMAWVSRQMSADFAPFSPYVLDTDRIVTEWAIVAPEIRALLREKALARGESGGRLSMPEALQTVSYGIHGDESEVSDAGWRWTTRHVTLFAHPRARSVRMTIGAVALPGLPQGPVAVTVNVNRATPRLVALPVGSWTVVEVPLSSKANSRRMHRIDLRFGSAVVPAEADPASRDSRELSARVREIELAW